MKEYLEIRIPEENARKYLQPDQGVRLSSIARKLMVEVGSSLYYEIGQLQSEAQREGKFFFLGWEFHRWYSSSELKSSKLFQLEITAAFEPVGEECGTVYDESTACKVCQAGRKQISPLVLDLRRLPKKKEIARSIADEWVVSQRLAELLVSNKISGIELTQVRHYAQNENDPVDPELVPSGKELLRLAKEADVHFPDWDFWVWFNRSENSELIQKVNEEYLDYSKAKDRQVSKPLPVWYQLEITSKPVPIASTTKFGIAPFCGDVEEQYKCPFGHVKGLNQLSELTIQSGTWNGDDFLRTEEMVGVRRGVLVPSPLILISRKVRELFEKEGVKGYRIEVAHEE